jgi:hypothetical protein
MSKTLIEKPSSHPKLRMKEQKILLFKEMAFSQVTCVLESKDITYFCCGKKNKPKTSGEGCGGGGTQNRKYHQIYFYVASLS